MGEGTLGKGAAMERPWLARRMQVVSMAEESRDRGARQFRLERLSPGSFYLSLLCFPESYQENGFCSCQTRFFNWK